MFCFETAFKLLTLSWAAYEDEEPPAGCETLCTLQKLSRGSPESHTPKAGVVADGECRCSHRLSSLKEVCTDNLPVITCMTPSREGPSLGDTAVVLDHAYMLPVLVKPAHDSERYCRTGWRWESLILRRRQSRRL